MYKRWAKYTFSFALECRKKEKHFWVDNIVCRVAIDLQTPADMFHFPLFSMCLSILWVHSDITRATWVDDWWCPLVNIASYMCHRPKEPTSSTYSFFIYLFIFPSYLFTSPPSSTRSIFFVPLPSLFHLSSLRLFFKTVALQSKEEWDHLFLCAHTHFFFLSSKLRGLRISSIRWGIESNSSKRMGH